MKIIPLAIFCSNLRNEEEIERAVIAEVNLTHPEKLVQDACIIYVMTLIALINTGGNLLRAFEKAKEYLFKRNHPTLIDMWEQYVEHKIIKPGTPKMGWIMISWTQCFALLKKIINI